MPSQWLMRGCGGTKTSIWFVEGPFARAGSSSALTTTLVARDADRREIFAGDTFLEEPAFVLEIVGANIVVAEMHRIATPLAVMVVLQTLKPNALSRLARGWRGEDVAAVREIEKASNPTPDLPIAHLMGNNHQFFTCKQSGRVLIYVIVVLVAGGLYPDLA